MAELTAQGIYEPEPGSFTQATVMRLYCWQHRTVHAFPLADVERIVYVLGLMAVADLGDYDEPECLLGVLPLGHEWAEHAKQGVECRKAAPPT